MQHGGTGGVEFLGREELRGEEVGIQIGGSFQHIGNVLPS